MLLLNVFNSPDIDVRRKALRIAMDLVSSRNVQDVILFLKKELVKTHDQEYEKVCITHSYHDHTRICLHGLYD